eukprot:SAG11_NODE_32109_length_286_cov_0.834225_1_plen_26_part_01
MHLQRAQGGNLEVVYIPADRFVFSLP